MTPAEAARVLVLGSRGERGLTGDPLPLRHLDMPEWYRQILLNVPICLLQVAYGDRQLIWLDDRGIYAYSRPGWLAVAVDARSHKPCFIPHPGAADPPVYDSERERIAERLSELLAASSRRPLAPVVPAAQGPFTEPLMLALGPVAETVFAGPNSPGDGMLAELKRQIPEIAGDLLVAAPGAGLEGDEYELRVEGKPVGKGRLEGNLAAVRGHLRGLILEEFG